MTYSLPPLLREIADILGEDAAIKFAQAKGGQRIVVPGHVHADHWLVDLLGMVDAQKLCDYFTNGSYVHIDVPYGPTGRHARRRALVAKLHEEGNSANEIAAATGLTRRRVFSNLKAIRSNPDSVQGDLFDDL